MANLITLLPIPEAPSAAAIATPPGCRAPAATTPATVSVSPRQAQRDQSRDDEREIHHSGEFLEHDDRLGARRQRHDVAEPDAGPDGADPAVRSQAVAGRAAGFREDTRAELRRLRRENRELQMRCEILKKTVSYFAKDE